MLLQLTGLTKMGLVLEHVSVVHGWTIGSSFQKNHGQLLVQLQIVLPLQHWVRTLLIPKFKEKELSQCVTLAMVLIHNLT